ncbi:unknown [Clostridium sp. CAG:768]|mgnify:CR=1 FL=1|nr:unknown [Clostridium sp. CAG:768]
MISYALQLQPHLSNNFTMILNEFSKYIQSKNEDITSGKSTGTKILCDWIKIVINKNPKNHVDKIVHKEIMLAENKSGDFLIVGKSESGRTLVNALYNYALSYEHYIMSKWLKNKKPQDFNSQN